MACHIARTEVIRGLTATLLSRIDIAVSYDDVMPTPILATKIYIPSPQPSLVPRPRLIERLNIGLLTRYKLTLIAAPAGFGKTALLSDWVVRNQHPVAWLSLDIGDNDLVRFLTYVIAALQSIDSKICAETLDMLQARQPAPIDLIVTSLIHDIAKISQSTALVLDDYHLIEAQPVHDAITFLLDHLPQTLHLFIASRSDPPLPLSRLRARGQLVELRATDVRFTASESASFLSQEIGSNLTAEDASALEARTEGWITGLQLAALSMRGRKDIAGFVRAFTGTHRYIIDYLVEEVLQRQPAHIRSFLLQTSILERLCGPLCDAVTGQTDGASMLHSLERANLFLVPLDDQRQWFRYHHLFAEVLQARLQAALPDQATALHQIASKWYEQNQLPHEAIRHALAAGDVERVADLIELALPNMRQSRQDATLRGWLKALPDALVRRRPVLSVHLAWALLVAGDLDAVEPRLQDAEKWLEKHAAHDEQLQGMTGQDAAEDNAELRVLPVTVAIYRAALAQALGDIAGTARHSRQALDRVQPGDYLGRGAAAGLLGLAHWASGDLELARQSFSEARSSLHLAGNIADTISSTVVLADMQIAQGRLREACRVLEQALQLATTQGEPAPQATADVLVALADLYCEYGDLDAAKQHLQRSRMLGERASLFENRYRWPVAMARILVAEGDLDGALRELNKAERLYIRGFFPDVRPVAALQARIWITQGRLAEAWSWIRQKGLSIDDTPTYLHEFEHLTLVRLCISQFRIHPERDSIQLATTLLGRLLSAAEAGGRSGSVNEILLLQALAFEVQGQMPRALASLERVLASAGPEGYVRLFVDEGPPMAALLQLAAQRGIESVYVRRLLDAFGQPDDPVSIVQDSVESLSAREMDVLRLLRTELSGPEITRELKVSANTFHTHTRNIYAKLGVKTRQAAVRRAQELHLP